MFRDPLSRRDLLGRSALAAVAALGALATACSNDDSAGGGGERPASTAAGATTTTVDVPEEDFEDRTGSDVVDVSVVDNAFEPRWVVVSTGTRVRWTNNGRNHHNIVPEPEGSFEGIEQERFTAGSVHAVTFDTPGDYPYYCSLHGTPRNGQNGVIRVVD